MSKCLVCGRRSTGVHYGVESCEGCKAFYKRGLACYMNYKCYFGNKCFDDGIATNRCKACRFRRCSKLGMNVLAPKRGRKLKELSRKDQSEKAYEVLALPDQTPSKLYRGRFGHNHDALPFEFCNPSTGTSRASSETTNIDYGSPQSQSDFWSQLTQRTHERQRAEAAKKPASARVSVIRSTFGNKKPLFTMDDLRDEEEEITTNLSPGSLVPFKASETVQDKFSQIFKHSPKSVYLTANKPGNFADPWQQNIPQFLNDYWGIIQQRGFALDSSIANVLDAAETAFGDFISLWNSFRLEINRRGVLPPLKNMSMEDMILSIQVGFTGFVKRVCQFLFLLPGFNDFDKEDQTILMTEKFTESWMTIHAPYLVADGEWHILIGDTQDIHVSQYWMRQMLVPELYELLFDMAAELNDIELTHLERFILLCVATFHPDYTTAKNKPLLSFLHSHYMDCLLHSIRSRCSRPQQLITEVKLQNFTRHFRTFYRLNNFYVRLMNYTTAPFKAIKDSRDISLTEALSREDDGLQPKLENLSPLLLV